ncbi:MAG: hypothetical protein KAX86_07390, partial [Anaerolineales bacterium]|nr:hypothetical protein [Anaerolineales bacterium]
AVKRETITSAFTLENGSGQLQEFFPRVELTKYLDNLRVKELSAVRAYIRSMTSTADLQEDAFQTVERELAEIMKKNGEIFISKDSGLFKAWK